MCVEMFEVQSGLTAGGLPAGPALLIRQRRGVLMELHFTAQDFQVFANGELPKDKARALVAHLLRGCRACQAESAALWRAPKAVPEEAYDAVFDRALAA